MFERELRIMIHNEKWDSEQLSNLVRSSPADLNDHLQWVRLVAIQASLEYLDAQERQARPLT